MIKWESSVTDWIQTIVIVGSVLFAMWEFVLHDRTMERERKLYTLELLSYQQSPEYNNSSLKLIEDVKHGLDYVKKDLENGGNGKNIDQKLEFSKTIAPLLIYYNSWSLCFKHDLCDKKIGIETACDSTIPIKGWIDDAEKLHKGTYVEYSSAFSDFAKHCESL